MTAEEIEGDIREIINSPRRQYKIMQDRRAWFQLCTALDTLGDSGLAMNAFVDGDGKGVGEGYLRLYGVLQAMFLQQDATTHIAEALQIRLNDHPSLKNVRNVRNDVIGHPTKRGGNTTFTTHAIARYSVSSVVIDVFSSDRDGSSLPKRTIDLNSLIEQQKTGVCEQLASIISELRRREDEHKMEFSDESLEALIPQTIRYSLIKIVEGANSAEARPIAVVNLEHVVDVAAKFREALERRGEVPANDHLVLSIKECQHPLSRLQQFFDDNGCSSLTAEDVDVYVFYLMHKLEELREIAKELDDEYQTGDGSTGS